MQETANGDISNELQGDIFMESRQWVISPIFEDGIFNFRNRSFAQRTRMMITHSTIT